MLFRSQEEGVGWPGVFLTVHQDPGTGKDCGKERKGTIEDKMVGWHHQLNGHEFEQIPGDREGQGSLACCSPWESKRVGQDLATEQDPCKYF